MWHIAKTVMIIVLVIVNIAMIAVAVYLYGYATGSHNEYQRNQQFKDFRPERVPYTGVVWLIKEF